MPLLHKYVTFDFLSKVRLTDPVYDYQGLARGEQHLLLFGGIYTLIEHKILILDYILLYYISKRNKAYLRLGKTTHHDD